MFGRGVVIFWEVGMLVLSLIRVFSDPRWAGENGHCLLRAAPVPSLTGSGRRFPATDFSKTIPPLSFSRMCLR